MRMLFTTIQRHGHLQPLLPIAHAARAAGHTVAVACAASFVPHVERAGFRAFPAGFDDRGRPPRALFPGLRTVPEQDAASWLIPRLSIGAWATAMTPTC
jgi:UDP:flavonoid glycosyltransferase YjiC (YdhE family)